MKIPKKPFSGYFALLGESWHTVWKNPIAFFPVVYSYIIIIAYFALAFVIGLLISGGEITMANASGIIIYIIVALIGSFFVFSHVNALSIGVFHRLSRKKKITLKEAFLFSKNYYWRILRFTLVSIVAAIPLLIALGVIYLLQQSATLSPLVLVFVILLFVLFYSMWFLFALAHLASSKDGVWKTLAVCWKLLLKEDSRFVIFTDLIIIFLSIAVSIILGLFAQVIGLNPEGGLYNTINILLNALLSVLIMQFVFTAYARRYG